MGCRWWKSVVFCTYLYFGGPSTEQRGLVRSSGPTGSGQGAACIAAVTAPATSGSVRPNDPGGGGSGVVLVGEAPPRRAAIQKVVGSRDGAAAEASATRAGRRRHWSLRPQARLRASCGVSADCPTTWGWSRERAQRVTKPKIKARKDCKRRRGRAGARAPTAEWCRGDRGGGASSATAAAAAASVAAAAAASVVNAADAPATVAVDAVADPFRSRRPHAAAAEAPTAAAADAPAATADADPAAAARATTHTPQLLLPIPSHARAYGRRAPLWPRCLLRRDGKGTALASLRREGAPHSRA